MNNMDFDFKKIEMRELDRNITIEFISKNHYSRTCPKIIMLSLGFYYNNELCTVVVFSIPPNRNSFNAISDLCNANNSWELSRLYSLDWCPRNTESYCIGKSIKYIKNKYSQIKYLLSFADSNWGHYGYIYQATNWLYVGQIRPRNKIILDGQMVHSKTLSNKHGTESKEKLKEIYGDRINFIMENSGKYKYIYIISHNKKQYKELFSNIKYTVLPYPKGESKYYK